MMKKLLALLLALTMVFAFAACTTDEGNNEENNGEANNGETNGEGTESALKIGVILLHDESIGYDFAHMQGIRTACETLGIDWNDNNQVIWKYNIGEDESCHSAAVDLVDQGCNVIISDSYGHQSYMTLAASENPDVSSSLPPATPPPWIPTTTPTTSSPTPLSPAMCRALWAA